MSDDAEIYDFRMPQRAVQRMAGDIGAVVRGEPGAAERLAGAFEKHMLDAYAEDLVANVKSGAVPDGQPLREALKIIEERLGPVDAMSAMLERMWGAFLAGGSADGPP